jgi:hypothetical protein
MMKSWHSEQRILSPILTFLFNKKHISIGNISQLCSSHLSLLLIQFNFRSHEKNYAFIPRFF